MFQVLRKAGNKYSKAETVYSVREEKGEGRKFLFFAEEKQVWYWDDADKFYPETLRGNFNDKRY